MWHAVKLLNNCIIFKNVTKLYFPNDIHKQHCNDAISFISNFLRFKCFSLQHL